MQKRWSYRSASLNLHFIKLVECIKQYCGGKYDYGIGKDENIG